MCYTREQENIIYLICFVCLQEAVLLKHNEVSNASLQDAAMLWGKAMKEVSGQEEDTLSGLTQGWYYIFGIMGLESYTML